MVIISSAICNGDADSPNINIIHPSLDYSRFYEKGMSKINYSEDVFQPHTPFYILVSVKSTPDSAWIWFMGKNSSKKTPYQIYFYKRGEYLVEVRNGNNICSKEIPINPPETISSIEFNMMNCECTML